MAYIGREPQVGNFQVCDAISVVNGQAAYTMQVGGVNVSPETANHMLVSLNGVLQAPGSSYTVSGSTITFASNLVTGDVINFIHILGSVLDLGVPSDATVTSAKIVDDAITLAKMAPGTDGNLITYDASGNPVAVATGSSGQVLTSAGAGAVPSFQSPAGGGKVGQVIVATATASVGSVTSVGSYADFSSAPTIAITPSATNSKVLIEFSGIFSAGGSSNGCDVAITDSSNNVIIATGMYGSRRHGLTLWTLHSANTSSEITYKVRGKVNSSGGHNLYLDSGTSDPLRTTFFKATEILA